jgi:hypothetical protein
MHRVAGENTNSLESSEGLGRPTNNGQHGCLAITRYPSIDEAC